MIEHSNILYHLTGDYCNLLLCMTHEVINDYVSIDFCNNGRHYGLPATTTCLRLAYLAAESNHKLLCKIAADVLQDFVVDCNSNHDGFYACYNATSSRGGRVLLVMVFVPGLHPPGSVTVDILLPTNQANTRCSRDVGVDICGNVRWSGYKACPWYNDSGHVGESFCTLLTIKCSSIRIIYDACPCRLASSEALTSTLHIPFLRLQTFRIY